MNIRFLTPLLSIGLITACTGPITTYPASRSGYIPAFTRVPAGYQATIPSYYPNISYVDSKALPTAEIRHIQHDFYYPLVQSDYRNFIGAIVINGAPRAAGTTFTIWLLDGRRLEAAPIGPSPLPELGRAFLRQAFALLRDAIPAAKLQESRRAG